MSLVPVDKSKEDIVIPPPGNNDWGRFGSYANEQPGYDQVSTELSKQTLAWLLGILIAIVVGLFTVQVVSGSGNPTWLVLAAVGVTGFVVLWRNLEWGIIGYLLIAWMVVGTPDLAQGGGGAGQKVMVSQAGLAVLVLVWGLRTLLSQRLTLYKSPVNLPIFAYLAFTAWSTINSLMFPNHAVLEHSAKTFLQVNILEYGMRFLALIGALVIGNTLKGKQLRFAAIAMMIPALIGFSGVVRFIPSSSYQAFTHILAIAVLGAFALTDAGPMKWRIAAGTLALVIVGVHFIRDAEWVSGWSGALVALALVTWRANRKLLIGIVIVLSMIIAANFPYFYAKVYTSNFYADRTKRGHRAEEEQGTFTNDRSRMLYAATRYAEIFPLGIGLGNYRAYNTWFGRPENWDTTTFTSAHGTYSQVISETGWGGCLLFFWLLYTNASLMNRVYKALPPGRWRTYTLGAWGGCIGIYVSAFNGDYIFPAYHNGGLATFGSCVYTHLMVGIIIAVAKEKGVLWNPAAAKAISAWPVRPIQEDS